MNSDAENLGVAEAKARFSELIERVAKGKRITITRRGRPVLVLVAPEQARLPWSDGSVWRRVQGHWLSGTTLPR